MSRKESLDHKIEEPLPTDLQQVNGEEGSSEVNTVKEHEVKMENPDNEIRFEVLSKQSSASRTRVEEDYKIVDEDAEKKKSK